MYVRVLGSIHLPYSFSSTYFQYRILLPGDLALMLKIAQKRGCQIQSSRCSWRDLFLLYMF